MTPEEKELLQRIANQVEENNEILRRMRNANRWGIAFRVLYWVLIISLSFGAFYFIQPYLEMLGGLGGDFKNGLNQTNQIGELIKQF